MAGTEGTSKVEDKKAEADTNNGENTPKPQGQVRKYFLPETGQVVEAESAEAAAAKLNEQNDKGKEG